MTIVATLGSAIETCEKVLSGELLPHQVDAWKLWELLSKASDRLAEPREYLLYASLMKLIIATVRLQCRWLRYEADELYVDSDIAREKTIGLSTRTLNSIFLRSFHPLAEIEQLTRKAMEIGREHWDELSGNAGEQEIPHEGFLTYGAASGVGRLVLQEVQFQQLLDGLEQELIEASGKDGGEVPYLRFISRGGSASFPEMVTRSYLGSFLVSQGKYTLKPNGADLKLVASGAGPGHRTQSLAVILRRLTGKTQNAVHG